MGILKLKIVCFTLLFEHLRLQKLFLTLTVSRGNKMKEIASLHLSSFVLSFSLVEPKMCGHSGGLNSLRSAAITRFQSTGERSTFDHETHHHQGPRGVEKIEHILTSLSPDHKRDRKLNRGVVWKITKSGMDELHLVDNNNIVHDGDHINNCIYVKLLRALVKH